jgi:microcin C transport system substrate-binding protein
MRKNSAGRSTGPHAGLSRVATRWVPAAALAVLTPLVAAQTAAPAAAAAAGAWVHGYAVFGAPKYARDFHHFEYVNPDAPKGGTIYLANPDRRTSFDKFNDFTVKGNAPAGIVNFMLEPLTVRSADEPLTMYGLLAEEMLIAPDKSAITFRLNPKARFNNGDPVLALDVKYTYDTITSKYAAPSIASSYAGVKGAVVVDDRTVRFDITDKSADTLFNLGSLFIFSHKWGLQPDGSHKRFDEIISEIPITSGPYTIASEGSGRRIEFKRNPDYWARDLPVRRGFYNFDRVVYRYYQDEAVATEAFKAGEYDLVKVYNVRIWARQHRGAKWDDGRIVALTLPSGTGQGLQSYQLNLRRPIFQDIRVREALNLTYDFETNNRYHRLKRANSVFNNSELAAQGAPSPGELRLLEPFRASLPQAVFGPAFVNPRTDRDVNELRGNLLKARGLLEAAGWKLASDGVLRNAKGEPFEFEYLATTDQDTDPRMNPWRHNLDKLGIVIKDRKVDGALFTRRLEEYDFDMILLVEGSFTLPSVADYVNLYGSKSADEKGNANYRGIKSPAVDRMLEAIGKAATMEEFRDAARALDRIVMWSYWQVPEVYGDFEDVSYWNKFGIPAVRPKYFTIDVPFNVDPELPWPLATWWIKDPARR